MASVDPSLVIQAVIDRLEANKATLGITAAAEISEDPSPNLKPAYVGVFGNTEQPALERANEGIPIDVPIEIVCLVFSREHKTSKDSMAEAWAIARKLHPVVRGHYAIDPGTGTPVPIVVLPSDQKPPLEIQRKAASQSIVAVNLFYLNPEYE